MALVWQRCCEMVVSACTDILDLGFTQEKF